MLHGHPFLALVTGGYLLCVALGACVALTVGIESAQLGIPGRVPADRDLVANSLGGVIGVAVALVLTLPATRGRRRVRDRERHAEGAR